MGTGSVAVWAVASFLLLGDRVNSPTDRASRCESEVAELVRNVKTDSASTVFLRTKTKRSYRATRQEFLLRLLAVGAMPEEAPSTKSRMNAKEKSLAHFSILFVECKKDVLIWEREI